MITNILIVELIILTFISIVATILGTTAIIQQLLKDRPKKLNH